VCEAILKVFEEGLVKPFMTIVYQLRENVEEEREEQQMAGEGAETAAVDEGEAAVVEMLEGDLDEEDDDDDDEEVEVLDVGEVTEEGEEDEYEEEVEDPSLASVASITSAASAISETSENPEPEPDPDPDPEPVTFELW